MKKRPIDMTDKELQGPIERAEMTMFIATDFAKTETERSKSSQVSLPAFG